MNSNGSVIAKSRDRAGAIETAMTVLADYRSAIETGSGYLYGNPRTKGSISIDGVTGLVGSDTIAEDLVCDLDKRGAEGARDFYRHVEAMIQADCDAADAAADARLHGEA